MDWKRYYFKRELDQLPEHIWLGFKSSEVMRQIQVKEKAEIIQQIDQLPDQLLEQLRHSLELIWRESDRQLMSENLAAFTPAILSETCLAKDWLQTQEDEAWKDL